MGGDADTGWVVDLAGVPVRLSATGARRRLALRDLLGGATPHAGPASAEIAYAMRAPATPRRPPDLEVADLRIWREPERLVVEDGAGAVAMVTRARARIGGEADSLELRYRRLLHLAAGELLAWRGRFLLHAAGIVRGDRALLAFGESGAGKSTLALAAAEGGDGLLGDDILVIRPARGAPEATGLGLTPAVPGDLGGALAAGGRPLGDYRARISLPREVLTPGWVPVGGCILLRHGASPAGGLRAIGGREVLYAALSAFGGGRHAPMFSSFFPLAAALARLPRWELSHGSEPTGRLAAARRWLDDCDR